MPVSSYYHSRRIKADMCRRTGEEFTGFESKFDGCCVVMEPLTRNTYVLVVASDPRVGTFLDWQCQVHTDAVQKRQ